MHERERYRLATTAAETMCNLWELSDQQEELNLDQMMRRLKDLFNEVLIKFVAPRELKRALQELANERNITLSALLRLVTSEYVKRKGST